MEVRVQERAHKLGVGKDMGIPGRMNEPQRHLGLWLLWLPLPCEQAETGGFGLRHYGVEWPLGGQV